MVESKNCIYFSPSIVVHCVRDDVTVKSTIDAKFLEVKLWLTKALLLWWILI